MSNNIIEKEDKKGTTLCPVAEFLSLHRTFESRLPKLMATREGKKAIRDYVNCVKGDKALHQQFLACNTVFSSRLGKGHASEVISVLPFLNESALRMANTKVRSLMESAGVIKDNGSDIIALDDKVSTIAESINYLVTHSPKIDNITKVIENRERLLGFMEENNANAESSLKESKSDEEKDYNGKIAGLIKELNEKVESIEDEAIRKTVNDIVSIHGKEIEEQKKLFQKYVKEAVEVINPLIKEKSGEAKEKLLDLKEMVLDKEFSQESLSEDIIELATIRKTLSKD